MSIEDFLSRRQRKGHDAEGQDAGAQCTVKVQNRMLCDSGDCILCYSGRIKHFRNESLKATLDGLAARNSKLLPSWRCLTNVLAESVGVEMEG